MQCEEKASNQSPDSLLGPRIAALGVAKTQLETPSLDLANAMRPVLSLTRSGENLSSLK